MEKKTLIVLPSYNERHNIVDLVRSISSLEPNYFVCVVDDNSPDGTALLLSEAIIDHGWENRVHLLSRVSKGGRGGAIRDGLAWGRHSGENFEAFVEMDCDFSHPPEDIPRGLSMLDHETGLAMGVRYPRGKIIGWPLTRRVFSFFANLLVRLLIEPSIKDYTNGFRFYAPEVVDILLQHTQKHTGYIYLTESLAYLLKAGVRVSVFPITFRNRQRGTSNTTPREIYNALVGLLDIAWNYRIPKK